MKFSSPIVRTCEFDTIRKSGHNRIEELGYQPHPSRQLEYHPQDHYEPYSYDSNTLTSSGINDPVSDEVKREVEEEKREEERSRVGDRPPDITDAEIAEVQRRRQEGNHNPNRILARGRPNPNQDDNKRYPVNPPVFSKGRGSTTFKDRCNKCGKLASHSDQTLCNKKKIGRCKKDSYLWISLLQAYTERQKFPMMSGTRVKNVSYSTLRSADGNNLWIF